MEKEPVVGSIWRARDGRIVRVDRLLDDPIWPFTKPRAEVTVINAHELNCRRKTTLGLDNFGVGRFLNFHAANDAVLSSPRHPRELTP